MSPDNRTAIREGKSKILFAAEQPNQVIQYFKDDATAFNALKKGQIKDKGKINNLVSSSVFKFLEKNGIETHFVGNPTEREMLCKKVTIIPVEVVVRNFAAGSVCKRLGLEKGMPLSPAMVEYFYKDDGLGDPLIGEGHIIYFKWATPEELLHMTGRALMVNKLLIPVFDAIGMKLVDFKLEFGRDAEGNVLLADEFTADGCRLWDKVTGESMDKDRFRHDMGKVDESYADISSRLAKYFEGKL